MRLFDGVFGARHCWACRFKAKIAFIERLIQRPAAGEATIWEVGDEQCCMLKNEGRRACQTIVIECFATEVHINERSEVQRRLIRVFGTGKTRDDGGVFGLIKVVAVDWYAVATDVDGARRHVKRDAVALETVCRTGCRTDT